MPRKAVSLPIPQIEKTSKQNKNKSQLSLFIFRYAEDKTNNNSGTSKKRGKRGGLSSEFYDILHPWGLYKYSFGMKKRLFEEGRSEEEKL